MDRLRLSVLLVVLGGVLLLPRTVPAQEVSDSVTLSGWIVDATSRQPLSGAYLVVEGNDARTATGSGGGFRLAVPRAEGYTLRVGRFGYLEMDFRIGAELVSDHLILPLEVDPIEIEGLEVTVDRLAELERQLERRERGYAGGPVRTFDTERIAGMGAPSALDVVLAASTGLFECLESPSVLCARPRQVVTLRGPPPRETPVPVCLDERQLWGGTAELLGIPAAELYRVEFYGFGSRAGLRLYTRRFMARSAAQGRRVFLPVATPGRERMLEC